MDAFESDILVRHPVPRRRLTVAEYYRLGEVGILGEDDRVELLEGQLVQLPPIDPRHASVVATLTAILVTAVGGRGTVRVQSPITLDDGSEPQPDFAVVAHKSTYKQAHPRPADIFLLVEISDSSLPVDAGVKLAMYAKAGIREYWIVDLMANSIRVHHRPCGLVYRSITTETPQGTLEIKALPGISIAAAAILA